MTREQIEKATMFSCISKDEVLTDFGRNCFIEGAQWRINAVWHDGNEKPNKNQLVLFECRKTYGKGYSVNFGENYELLKNVVIRWAYVIDLLPERKEETE